MQRQHPGPVAADLLNRIHDDTGGDEIAARADLWLKLNVLLTEAVPESTTDGAARTIERLSAQAPQRVCTRTFSLGDVIWKCRTCQVGDETCVVCQACFQGGEHDGHDVSFYVSRQPDGGCCDCGDESAWSPNGFCKKHGKVADLDSVPAPLRAPATSLFHTAFGLLANTILAAHMPPPPPPPDQPTAVVKLIHPARVRRCVAAVEWVTQTCVAFDGLCGVACGALLSPLRQMAFEAPEATGNLSELLAELRMIDLDDRGPDINGIRRGPSAPKLTSEIRLIMDRGVDTTRSGLSLLESLLLADALLRDLGGPLPAALQALYLRLLTNAGFKAAFASAYARHYTEIAMCYAHSTAAESDGPRESLVFASQISVQFFNRPAIVWPLVSSPETCLYKQMLVLLTNLVSEAAASTTRHISETSLIIRKRYAPIISDMRFVLAIPAVPQLLLRSPQHMKLWTQLLASLQAFDPQYRQAPSLEHVEHEHDGWIGCFNFLIYVTSLMRFALRPLNRRAEEEEPPHEGNEADSGLTAAMRLHFGSGATDNTVRAGVTNAFGLPADFGGMSEEGMDVCEPCNDVWPAVDINDDPMGGAGAAASSSSSADGSGGAGESVQWPLLIGDLLQWASQLIGESGYRANTLDMLYSPCLLPAAGEPPVVILDTIHSIAHVLSFHYPLHRFIAAAAQRYCTRSHGVGRIESLKHELRTRSITHNESHIHGSGVDNDTWQQAAHTRRDKVRILRDRDVNEHSESDFEVEASFTLSGAEVLMMSPLRLMGSVSCILGGMWARNGTCMLDQTSNYVSINPPLCRQFIDLDRLAVQLSFSVMRPLECLGALFVAFGQRRMIEACAWQATHDAAQMRQHFCAAPMAGHDTIHPDTGESMGVRYANPADTPSPAMVVANVFGASWPRGANDAIYRMETTDRDDYANDLENKRSGLAEDVRQRTTLLEEALHSLLQMTTHLPRPPGKEHEKSAIRATLTHLLLLRPRSYSELSDAAIQADDELPDSEIFQEILDEVSVSQPGTSQYTLRDGLAVRDYSITFPHLSRPDHQTAYAERIESALRRASPTAAADRSPPSPVHPALVEVRRLCAHPVVMRLIRSILVHALFHPISQTDASRCIDRAIHLLELAARTVHDPATPPEEADATSERANAFWQSVLWKPTDEKDGSLPPCGAELDDSKDLSLLAALSALINGAESRTSAMAKVRENFPQVEFNSSAISLSVLSASIGRWFLKEAGKRSTLCAEALEALGAKNARPAASAELEAKRQRQKEKKAAQMALFKKRNAAFASMHAEEIDSAEPTVSPNAERKSGGGGSPSSGGEASTHGGGGVTGMSEDAEDVEMEAEGQSCIMCHGAWNNVPGGMVALAYAHASRLRDAGMPFNQNDQPEGLNSRNHLKRIQEAPQSIFACGHAMHLGCWRRHLQTHMESQRQILVDEAYNDDATRREANCPLCRAACNVVLPLVPVAPAATRCVECEPKPDSGGERAKRACEWLGKLSEEGKRYAASVDAAIFCMRENTTGIQGDTTGVASSQMGTRHASALLRCLQDLHELRNPARSTEDGIRLVMLGESGPDGLPTNLLPALMSNWRGVALAFEATAHEWSVIGTPSAATIASLSAMTRALSLKPSVLFEALKSSHFSASSNGMQPEERTAKLAMQIAHLMPKLLRGELLEESELDESSLPVFLFGFHLPELIVVLALAMPPSNEAELRSMIELVGMIALIKAIQRACKRVDLDELTPGFGTALAEELGADALLQETEACSELRRIFCAVPDVGKTSLMTVDADAPQGAPNRTLFLVIEHEMRHFGRVASLLFGAIFGEPGGEAPKAPYPLLKASEVVQSADAMKLVNMWMHAFQAGHKTLHFESYRVPYWSSFILPQRTTIFPKLQLHNMPPNFAMLTSRLHERTCLACGKPPQLEPALCLICGALLCAGPSCKRVKTADEPGRQEGECTRHARRCGLGVGIFALVHQGVVLLVDGARSSFYPSLYLDAHGEEDRGLRRGKPLFLSAQRQAAIHKLWVSQAVPLEVARSRAAASHAAIRLGLY